MLRSKTFFLKDIGDLLMISRTVCEASYIFAFALFTNLDPRSRKTAKGGRPLWERPPSSEDYEKEGSEITIVGVNPPLSRVNRAIVVQAGSGCYAGQDLCGL